MLLFEKGKREQKTERGEVERETLQLSGNASIL